MLTKEENQSKEAQVFAAAADPELKETIEPEKESRINMLDETHLKIGEREYELITNYRDAFDQEKLDERFSEILGKYDYIVADWGFEQLRLKGFYEETNRRAPLDQRINTLEDYLYEYCNFGCAYFVLKQIGERKEQPSRNKKSRHSYKDKPYKGKKVETRTSPKKMSSQKAPVIVKKESQKTRPTKPKESTPPQPNKRHFKINKKEEN